jgi:hypothetical protein
MKDPEETLLVLKRARTLVESGWCQKAYATDAVGQQVRPEDPTAVAYCIRGALRAQEADTDLDALNDADRALERRAMRGIAGFNDQQGRTKDEVLTLFDRAIDDVKGEL